MHLIRRLIPTAMALLAVSGLLVACSDDDSGTEASASSTTDTTVDSAADTLTEGQFVEQGNALCVTHDQAVGEVVGPLLGGDSPSPDEQQAALDQIVSLSRGLSADIDALHEPDSLTGDVDALVDELDAGTEEAAGQTGAEFFGSDDDPWAEAGAMAKDLGLEACAPE